LMNLSDNPRLRLFTLCALYVAQGIPFGFVTVTLKAYLTAKDLDERAVGDILAMGTLPWAFKWVWGPIIDRFEFLPMGRRRPWILLAQTLMALTIVAMIAIPDLVAGVAALTWMVFLHNCFAALQDVSVDALAVDLLKEEERGKANGMMYGSSYLGTIVGGAGLGLVLGQFDLRVAMIVQVGLLLTIMLLPLLLRERAGERLLPWSKGRTMVPPEDQTATSVRGLFVSLARAFSLRSTLTGAALALGVKIGAGVFSAAASVHFQQHLGWSELDIITIEGGWAVWLGLAGCIVGGFLADRIGAKRLAAIATVSLGVAWIGFGLVEPYWTNRWLVIAMMITQEILLSVLSVSLFALFMSISWPVVAATQFTAYMALLNLSQTIGAKIAGPVSELMPLSSIYLTLGTVQIALIVCLALIDPHQTRRVLGHEPEA